MHRGKSTSVLPAAKKSLVEIQINRRQVSGSSNFAKIASAAMNSLSCLSALIGNMIPFLFGKAVRINMLHAVKNLLEIGEEQVERRSKFRTLLQYDPKGVDVVSVA